jgi:ubiquinone/menaquinone biosynthesis C-methylase UbiE
MRISGPRDEPPPRRQSGFLQGIRRSGASPPIEREVDWRDYDSIAEAYARVQQPRTALVAADVVVRLQVRPGWRVLDVGTGTGVGARAAASLAGPEGLVVGIDPAVGMLRVAARQAGAHYVQAVAIDLPFRDRTFDAVVSVFTVMHFSRYETALFDILRVLRPGGKMGVATWGPSRDEFSRTWDDIAHQFAGREMLQDAYRRAMPWSERFADRSRLKDALYEAGLRDIETEIRGYRFQITAEDYLESKEIAATGRFLHQMLGDRLWETFRHRTRAAFEDRFPPRFNDFRDVVVAVGTKPGA